MAYIYACMENMNTMSVPYSMEWGLYEDTMEAILLQLTQVGNLNEPSHFQIELIACALIVKFHVLDKLL